jgi:hypothetical protein
VKFPLIIIIFDQIVILKAISFYERDKNNIRGIFKITSLLMVSKSLLYFQKQRHALLKTFNKNSLI